MTPGEFKIYVDYCVRLEVNGNAGDVVEEFALWEKTIQEKYGKDLKTCISDTMRTKGYISKKDITEFKDDYHFLSNFSPSLIEYEGEFYHTVEHAYQGQKTLNLIERKRFTVGGDIAWPGKAKSVGGKVILRSGWNEMRLEIMEKLLRVKFIESDRRKKLVDTFPAELIEGNHWQDRFWGVCFGEGENHLGKLLMKIRDEFANEKSN